MRRFAYTLVIAALFLAGCNENRLVSDDLVGQPTPPGDMSWTDTFTQGVTAKVDILWVIDNSGSMGDEQTQLATHFNAFIQNFVTMDIDYHMAIVTTDVVDPNESGKFQGTVKVLTPDTPNLEQEFINNVLVGTGGSGTEMGLEAARRALTEPLISNENAGFLRDDAHLAILVVSDEDDGGSELPQPVQDPVSEFIRGFSNDVKHSQDEFSFTGVIGDVPGGCVNGNNNAKEGTRYQEAADLAATGLTESICASNFDPVLNSLSTFIKDVVLSDFPMTYAPEDSAGIEVYVDGEPIPPGEDTWYYDPDTNSIVYVSDIFTADCAETEISYQRKDDTVLSNTPGGTGVDIVCSTDIPFDFPSFGEDGKIIVGGDLDGGAIAECSFTGVRPSDRGMGIALLLIVGAALVITRRRKTA